MRPSRRRAFAPSFAFTPSLDDLPGRIAPTAIFYPPVEDDGYPTGQEYMDIMYGPYERSDAETIGIQVTMEDMLDVMLSFDE